LPERIKASLVKNLENFCIQMILKRGTASALTGKQPDIDEVNSRTAHGVPKEVLIMQRRLLNVERQGFSQRRSENESC